MLWHLIAYSTTQRNRKIPWGRAPGAERDAMTIFNPIETVQTASLQPTTGPQLVLAGSITAVVVFAAVVQHAAPQAALLPATCLALFVLAATVALLAWWRPVPSRQF